MNGCILQDKASGICPFAEEGRWNHIYRDETNWSRLTKQLSEYRHMNKD